MRSAFSIRSERFVFSDIFYFFTGDLPKELDKLVNLKLFDVAGNALTGPLSIRTERLRILTFVSLLFSGELSLEIIRMKAKDLEVDLQANKGFTLPSNIGELGDDITKLNLSKCSLTGPLSICTERFCVSLI